MDDWEGLKENNLNPYKKDPRSLVNAKPFFGGEKRKGYPKNTQFEDEDKETFDIGTNEKLIDNEMVPGEGIGGQDNTFTDPEDDPISLSKEPDPVGPHNMPHGNIFQDVKKKSPGLKWIRKV